MFTVILFWTNWYLLTKIGPMILGYVGKPFFSLVGLIENDEVSKDLREFLRSFWKGWNYGVLKLN